ncbi:MAG: hypothetical protein IKA90_00955 [Clostridia bacterium]|nr:hypothetical protein [Clostridia bacterium]
MKGSFCKKIVALVLAFVGICSVGGVAAAWVYADGPIDPVEQTLDVGLGEFLFGSGVYILSVTPVSVTTGSSVGTPSNNESALTATMPVTVVLGGESEVVYRVEFANVTNNDLLLAGTNSALSVQTDNFDHAMMRIDANDKLACDVTIFSSGTNQDVTFAFKKIDTNKQLTATVTQGATADSLDAIGDGYTELDYSSTDQRWTNWTSEASGRGQPSTLMLAFNDAKEVSSVTVYHFVDAGNPAPCDFAELIKIEYFDENSNQFVELCTATLTLSGSDPVEYTGATISQNWSNASRDIYVGSGVRVYSMDLVDAKGVSYTNVSFASGSGNKIAPQTTISFAKVNTSGLRITLDARDNCFVGVMEITAQ